MKEPKMIEVEILEPLTALQSALQAHAQASVDLCEHRESMRALRERINELQGAITETQAKASKAPAMARLNLEQIKALSSEKRADYEYLASLNAALDVANVELKNLESDERGLRMVAEDSKAFTWRALYKELLGSVDLSALATLASVGIFAGLGRSEIAVDLIGNDGDTDIVGIVTALSEQLGLPL